MKKILPNLRILKKTLRIAFVLGNLVVLAAGFVWARDFFNAHLILESFQEVSINATLATFFLSSLLVLLYAFRLSLLLGTNFRKALGTVILGFGLNGILPFRLGEVAKIGYAFRFYRISAETLALGTFAEKLADLGAIIVIGLMALQHTALPSIQKPLYFISVFFLAAVLAYFGLMWVLARSNRGGTRASRLDIFARNARNQINASTAGRVITLTVLIWLLTIYIMFIFFSSAYPSLDLWDATGLCVVVALAIAVPGAPAGLGLVEAGLVGYLQQFAGSAFNQALAVALVYRLVTSVPQILAAVLTIIYHSASLGRLKDSLARLGR